MRIGDMLETAAPCAPDSPRALGLAAVVNAFHHAPGRRKRPALDLPFFGATLAARPPLRPAPMSVLLRQKTLQSATHLALYAPALLRRMADPGDPAEPAGPGLAPAGGGGGALPERGRPPSARELRKAQKRAYDREYSRAARAARASARASAARAERAARAASAASASAPAATASAPRAPLGPSPRADWGMEG